jgi:hypothetical protein
MNSQLYLSDPTLSHLHGITSIIVCKGNAIYSFAFISQAKERSQKTCFLTPLSN